MDNKNENHGVNSLFPDIAMIAFCTFGAIIAFFMMYTCYDMCSSSGSNGNQERTTWTTETRNNNRVIRSKRHVRIQMSSKMEMEV